MRPPPSLPPPPGLASCRALVIYDDAAREALTALKNRGERTRITQLADELSHLVPPLPGLIVTWAPTGSGRRRARGYDHAELLARAVARRCGLPAVSLLRRLPGPAQAGQPLGQRRLNPRFLAKGNRHRPVLVVDDVVTSGATLSAAASALRAAGASEVHGLVVARAPRPGGE